MVDVPDNTPPGGYPDWQSAAAGGNLLSYLWANRPAMNELVPGYSPDESMAMKALDYGSLPARVATNALLGPLVTGGKALSDWMNGDQGPDVRRAITSTVLGMMGQGIGAPMRPAGSLGVFGGIEAKTANRDMLARAASMDARGTYSPMNIWQSTGWFKDVDGNWKFEIPDTQAKWTDKLRMNEYSPDLATFTYGPTPLGDLLHHPELFKAYPWLRNIPVDTAGPMAPLMGLKGAATDSEMYLTGGKPPEVLSTTLHEIQHMIQGREGFATGGNPGEFAPSWLPSFEKEAQDNLSRYRETLKAMGHDPYYLEYHFPDYMTGKTWKNGAPPGVTISNRAQKVNEAFDKVKRDLGPEGFDEWVLVNQNKNYASQLRDEAHQKYLSLAGEVESRNVQERHAQGSYDVFPLATEGYPTGDQIIRFGNSLARATPVDYDPFAKVPSP